ncbi:MAG: hypothetical protein FJ225_05245 [Lentisphaerae bacterium]|nr:hypothetical protein [Lentisphaerota bacterium]
MAATAAVLAAVLLGGCRGGAGRRDAADRQDPLMRRAAATAAQGDARGAVEMYAKALARDPGLVRAHLDVALLRHDREKDYLGAVYHYRRYLELRPDTEKRAMILNRMRLAEQLFAASILEADRREARAELEALRRENGMLKQRIADLEGTR